MPLVILWPCCYYKFVAVFIAMQHIVANLYSLYKENCSSLDLTYSRALITSILSIHISDVPITLDYSPLIK